MQRRPDLLRFMVGLPVEKVHRLYALLASLTTDRYHVMVVRLNSSPTPRFKKYMCIYTDVHPSHSNWQCQKYSAFSDITARSPDPGLAWAMLGGRLMVKVYRSLILRRVPDILKFWESHDTSSWSDSDTKAPLALQTKLTTFSHTMCDHAKELISGYTNEIRKRVLGSESQQSTCGSSDSAFPEAQASVGWTSTQERLFNMPLELFEAIEETLWETSFRPGKVFPQQSADANGRHHHLGESYQDPATRTFLALDRERYQRYLEIYWSQNTWVIGKGLPSYSVDFLRSIPDLGWWKIRSVHLKLTIKDLEDGENLHRFARNQLQWENLDDTLDTVKVLDIFRDRCAEFDLEVQQIWWDKFYAVSCLYLADLTLDMTKTYAPDGVYTGVELARTLPTFSSRKPQLTILAPDLATEEELHRVFAERNGWDTL